MQTCFHLPAVRISKTDYFVGLEGSDVHCRRNKTDKCTFPCNYRLEGSHLPVIKSAKNHRCSPKWNKYTARKRISNWKLSPLTGNWENSCILILPENKIDTLDVKQHSCVYRFYILIIVFVIKTSIKIVTHILFFFQIENMHRNVRTCKMIF